MNVDKLSYLEKTKLVKTEEYKKWFTGFCNKINTWSDNDFLYYDAEEYQYTKIISFFFSYVNHLAKIQHIKTMNQFEPTYYFELYQNFYEISLLIGQGAIVTISKTKRNKINNKNIVIIN